MNLQKRIFLTFLAVVILLISTACAPHDSSNSSNSDTSSSADTNTNTTDTQTDNSNEDTHTDFYFEEFGTIPYFKGGKYYDSFPSGSGITQLFYKTVDQSKIDAYVEQLTSLGYQKTEENSINENRFITCYGEKGIIHLSYINYNKTLSIILDSLQNSVYKAEEPAYTKVTDSSLAVMSLTYEENNSDANGMSYVITLEDGRYVIIDGGHRNKDATYKDAYILYNYLKDNNKRSDGKIIIAAWIFTHDHSDHHGAFTEFAINYSSKTELQYYVQNFGDKSRYDQQPSGWLNDGIPNDLIANYYKNAKKIVPHTGQILTFCNTEFELLCSQESHAPNKIQWVNDASLVYRMTSNGVKTIFLADAEAQTTKLLQNFYEDALKSDIMQIAHHGYSGGTVALYRNISPQWSLWPTNQSTFEQRSNGGGNGNAQVQNAWAKQNTICYVSDGEIEILTFVGGEEKISVSTYKPNSNK